MKKSKPGPGMATSATMFRLMLCALGLGLTACTAPPSVGPLLRVAEQAMLDEAGRIDADTQRDAALMHERRAALAAAFDADLVQRDTLDAEWIRDAAEVYAQAREALARREAALADERTQRARNLATAAQATRRARELIQRQDQLVIETLGVDVWQMLREGR